MKPKIPSITVISNGKGRNGSISAIRIVYSGTSSSPKTAIDIRVTSSGNMTGEMLFRGKTGFWNWEFVKPSLVSDEAISGLKVVEKSVELPPEIQVVDALPDEPNENILYFIKE